MRSTHKKQDLTRRDFIKNASLTTASLTLAGQLGCAVTETHHTAATKKPNILFAISDDQSWLHAGAYGDNVVKTPVFDRVARQGVLFNHAYCASPSCTPSRGGILSGQHIWRLRQGGQLYGSLPADIPVYTDLLQENGYHVGYTRKGWGPGPIKPGGRKTNPAGPKSYNSFQKFLQENQNNNPWCFWFGSHDPHRSYEPGSGVASGMKLQDVSLPPVLPDSPEIRSDICDYYFEIQRFDKEVGQILDLIKQKGQLENTLIVITSDNGMPFPRAKANLYDLGTRMPLAIAWKDHIPPRRIIDDFVSLTDLAPTFLQAADVKIPKPMTGKSLLPILLGNQSGRVDLARDHVVTARERHAFVRPGGLSYPSRAIRTHQYLYIRNYKPDRWPGGDPPLFGDIDIWDLKTYGPTKEYMMKYRSAPHVKHLFKLSFLKRPAEELYDLKIDPHQINNIAGNPQYYRIKKQLAKRLVAYLKKTHDARETDAEPMWDTWPYDGNKKSSPREGAPI